MLMPELSELNSPQAPQKRWGSQPSGLCLAGFLLFAVSAWAAGLLIAAAILYLAGLQLGSPVPNTKEPREATQHRHGDRRAD
jgi:hypothetical protein